MVRNRNNNNNRRNNNNQRRRLRRLPRQIIRPVTTVERTLRLADFPPIANDATFSINTIFVDSNFVNLLAGISVFYTEYRFTHLNFFPQTISATNVPGNVYLMFDHRLESAVPNSLDEVIARPNFLLSPVSNNLQISSNSSARGLRISRSQNQLSWYNINTIGNIPTTDESPGRIFFGCDNTPNGIIPAHLFVHFRCSYRN